MMSGKKNGGSASNSVGYYIMSKDPRNKEKSLHPEPAKETDKG